MQTAGFWLKLGHLNLYISQSSTSLNNHQNLLFTIVLGNPKSYCIPYITVPKIITASLRACGQETEQRGREWGGALGFLNLGHSGTLSLSSWITFWLCLLSCLSCFLPLGFCCRAEVAQVEGPFLCFLSFLKALHHLYY